MRRVRLVALAVLGGTLMALGTGLPIGLCPTEDSPNCVWIGPLQGNRIGSIVWNGAE